MFGLLISFTTVIIVSVQVTSPMVIATTSATTSTTTTTTLATNVRLNNITSNPVNLSNHQPRSLFAATTTTKALDLHGAAAHRVDVTESGRYKHQQRTLFANFPCRRHTLLSDHIQSIMTFLT